MEMNAGGEFGKGVRAAMASGRLLASCKALLRKLAAEFRQYRSMDVGELRKRLGDPAIVEAVAAIAQVEGREAPAEPLLTWPIRGLIAGPHRGLRDEEYAALERAGVVTFGDLLARAPEELIVLEGFGPSGLKVAEWALVGSGLHLARPDEAPEPSSPLYEMPATALLWGPSSRLLAALEKASIRTVADLLDWSDEDLLALEGFDVVSLDCVQSALRKFGLALAEPPLVVRLNRESAAA